MADTTDTQLPEYMSVRQVAERYGVSPGLIHRLVRRGEVPARRLGKSVRIARDDADQIGADHV